MKVQLQFPLTVQASPKYRFMLCFCNVAKVIFSQCSHFITGPDHQPITLRKRIIVRNYPSFTIIAVH